MHPAPSAQLSDGNRDERSMHKAPRLQSAEATQARTSPSPRAPVRPAAGPQDATGGSDESSTQWLPEAWPGIQELWPDDTPLVCSDCTQAVMDHEWAAHLRGPIHRRCINVRACGGA